MVAKFRNGGQACTAANRFYVHADVVEEFVARFGAAVEALRVGPGSDGRSQVGPLVSAQGRRRGHALVDAAVADGRGRRPPGQHPRGAGATSAPPTLLTGVRPESPILQAGDLRTGRAGRAPGPPTSEVLAWANDTEMGLAAYVYSGALQRALRLGEALDAGMVGINRGAISDPAAPFGGIKQSGLGREGAREGLREFQETQYLSLDWPA